MCTQIKNEKADHSANCDVFQSRGRASVQTSKLTAMVQPMTKSLMRLILPGLAMMVMAGCVSVLPKTAAPAPRYTISSVKPANVPASPVSWSLVIADPTSSQLFNTVKVPIMASKNRFEFLSGSEWVDRVPVLFERALVRTFENTEVITNVGDFTVLPVSDYRLRTDIRGFHADITGPTPVVVIEVFVRLLDGDGKSLTTRNFIARQDAPSAANSDLMVSFDDALDRVLTDITEWSFDAVASRRAENA